MSDNTGEVDVEYELVKTTEAIMLLRQILDELRALRAHLERRDS